MEGQKSPSVQEVSAPTAEASAASAVAQPTRLKGVLSNVILNSKNFFLQSRKPRIPAHTRFPRTTPIASIRPMAIAALTPLMREEAPVAVPSSVSEGSRFPSTTGIDVKLKKSTRV